jgi:hypothetical protein
MLMVVMMALVVVMVAAFVVVATLVVVMCSGLLIGNECPALAHQCEHTDAQA